MDFAKLAAERYSLRKFSDRPVEAEKLSAVLPLSAIPMQCMGYSLKEIKEDIFSGFLKDEMYQKILEILG